LVGELTRYRLAASQVFQDMPEAEAQQFAQRPQDVLGPSLTADRTDFGELVRVCLQRATSRLEAILLGIPPLVLAEFEEIRLGLQPPLAQGHYGLDLVNYLWHIKN
jgi:hypothetical protein